MVAVYGSGPWSMNKNSNQNKTFQKLLSDCLANSRWPTEYKLARDARVHVSTISMVKSGKRDLSQAVAIRLAKSLASDGTEWAALAPRLLTAGRRPGKTAKSATRSPLRWHAGSVADRVLRERRIQAGVIISSPFVTGEKQGFAVEFFHYLARVMGLEYGTTPLSFGGMKEALDSDKIDIIVTALLPTYQRSTFMSFTPPLPYLRVPLGGLCRNKTQWKDFEAGHLISEPTKTFRGAKLLLVKGEAGEEFANAFLHSDVMAQIKAGKGLLEEVKQLAPAELAARLYREDVDFLIADLATCKAVLDELGGYSKENPYAPLIDSSAVLPTLEGDEQFAQLASYPVVFGLKKGDPEWQEMLRNAFTYLMTEGIRSVIALYRKYDKGWPNFNWYFRKKFDGRDEEIPSLTRSYFEDSFRPKLESQFGAAQAPQEK
jgi:ABC-type amino acid transport substrate-binding protein